MKNSQRGFFERYYFLYVERKHDGISSVKYHESHDSHDNTVVVLQFPMADQGFIPAEERQHHHDWKVIARLHSVEAQSAYLGKA